MTSLCVLLASVLALTASVSAAPPPSCAMPAQGCETGMTMTDGDPFCTYDPATNTMDEDYLKHLEDLDYVVPLDTSCPGGGHVGIACWKQARRDYVEFLDTYWNNYRHCVCDAHEQWPNDSEELETALANCWSTWRSDMNTLKTAYIAAVLGCCTTP